MEAACFNMLEEGEVVLVAESGIWGERFADMAERNGKRRHAHNPKTFDLSFSFIKYFTSW